MRDKLFKAFIVPPNFAMESHPGQVPLNVRAQNLEKMLAKPKELTEADLFRDTSNRFTSGSVLDGLGLDRAVSEDYRKFLDGQVRAVPNETRFRQEVVERMLGDKLPPELRRVLADRAVTFYRYTKSLQKAILSLDDLRKAEPRGGSYFRRVTSGNGHRYYYNPDKYLTRDDAHVSGPEIVKERLAKRLSDVAGDGAKLKETFEALSKRWGKATVQEALAHAIEKGLLSKKEATK
jgi:hypothetical protein